ncbi:fungal-specific transcription factor domain-containing protein [Emericellopsis atlantica]|uniref:Fungal-specific transcription factor domain-containing protein n=1 Tax=Emericellopsis atlantica TaxID=2614577 RepID=A0A9P7ZN54_9HYPO|nr:fungal-specific transcription factor domain-containing protein [Emericellopsis atlantica]KAG9255100.1 fungal-specific transcription factor domain-containing protein [Emericellopsis atlantica]
MSPAALHGTACKVCRRRGRKCDRTLPTCLSCKRRGVECEGYVTRWPGVAARGKLAGQSIPVAASNSIHGSRTGAGHVSRGRHVSDGVGRNRYFQYVLPLVDTVPPIRYAIAASSASHIAARTLDAVLDQKSLSLRVRATHLLRERLNDPVLPTDEATLASIVMLAQLDMCSGDCFEFETHLKAAVGIIRDRQVDSARSRYFFEQRLAWLDIIISTTSTRLPYFTVEELKTALGRFLSHGKREWSYDVFPCPVDLCEMLVDISMLHKMQSNSAFVSQGALEKAECLMSRLRRMSPPQQELDGPREHMIEAWRLGIMAYAQRLFPHVERGDDTGTQTLVSQVLEHAERIPPATSWSYSLLWPIFQVGVALDAQALEEKAWIRSRLNTALRAVGCRHFSNALEALEYVWKDHGRRGSSAIDVFGRTIMLG